MDTDNMTDDKTATGQHPSNTPINYDAFYFIKDESDSERSNDNARARQFIFGLDDWDEQPPVIGSLALPPPLPRLYH